MSKFIVLLTVISFSFVSHASQYLKTISPECKSDALAFGEVLTNEAKSHFSHVARDYISFALALRKRIIEEGAISSQKYLDSDLNIRLTDFLNKKELNDDEKSFIKYVQEELATHPLLIDENVSNKLKEKFLNLI